MKRSSSISRTKIKFIENLFFLIPVTDMPLLPTIYKHLKFYTKKYEKHIIMCIVIGMRMRVAGEWKFIDALNKIDHYLCCKNKTISYTCIIIIPYNSWNITLIISYISYCKVVACASMCFKFKCFLFMLARY